MTRIVVTGATGFLGGALVRRLRRDGLAVLALGRRADRLAELAALGCDTAALDLAMLPSDTDPGPADALVHCAALSSPWGSPGEFERANVTGTEAALSLAARAGVTRFVHISSPTVCARFADQIAIDEAAPLPTPINDYARTKAISESLVRDAAGFQRVILRPRGLYGPGDETLLPRLQRAIARGPLPWMRGGRAVTNLTYIDDAVDGIVKALTAVLPSTTTIHLAGSETLPVTAVAEKVAGAIGQRIRWSRVPWPLMLGVTRTAESICAKLPGRPEPRITAYSAALFAFSQTLSIERAATELGWRPRTGFVEGLAHVMAARS